MLQIYLMRFAYLEKMILKASWDLKVSMAIEMLELDREIARLKSS